MYYPPVTKPRLPQPLGKQLEVLYLPAKGHTVVLGTAGSGKTTMAMHRAVHLADSQAPHSGKTLLLSFNNTLVRYFESFADLDSVNVDARTYHLFARGYLNTRGRMSYGAICSDPAERDGFIDAARSALVQEIGNHAAFQRPLAFLVDELKWIAQHGIATQDDYIEAERAGRQGARLPRKDRAEMFRLYQRYVELRRAAGKLYDWDDLAAAVEEEALRDGTPRLYRHIIIDEGQDFSPMMLRSLVALLPADGTLTFFGDMAQQIYGNKISWRTAGLTVSKVWDFRENYRNTKQVANLAVAIAAMPYFVGTLDLVPPNAPTADGPLPALVACRTLADEIALVAGLATQAGSNSSAAILLPTRDEEKALSRLLPGNAVRLHKDMTRWQHGSGVFYGTYAAAKGLEFDAVYLPRLSADLFPTVDAIDTYGKDDAEVTGGRLLYVGVTRARASLVLSYTGAPSVLLPNNASLYQRSQR